MKHFNQNPVSVTASFHIDIEPINFFSAILILATHCQKTVKTSQPPLNVLPVFIITEQTVLVQSVYVKQRSLLSLHLALTLVIIPSFCLISLNQYVKKHLKAANVIWDTYPDFLSSEPILSFQSSMWGLFWNLNWFALKEGTFIVISLNLSNLKMHVFLRNHW